MKKKSSSNIELPPEKQEVRPTSNSLGELEYEPLSDDKYELIEHIQETFGQGRNEVEAMINEYSNN